MVASVARASSAHAGNVSSSVTSAPASVATAYRVQSSAGGESSHLPSRAARRNPLTAAASTAIGSHFTSRAAPRICFSPSSTGSRAVGSVGSAGSAFAMV